MDIEAIKAFLATDEGKTLIDSSEHVAGLKSKRDELLSAEIGLKDKLRKYSELGDVEALSGIVGEYKALKDKKPEQKQEDDKSAQYIAELEHIRGELAKEQGLRTKQEQAYVGAYVNTELLSAITRANGEPEILKLALANRVKGVLNEDGSIGVEVLNKDGSPMFKNGHRAKLDDLVNEFKNSDSPFAVAFKAEGASGTGTRQSKGGKQAVSMKDNLTEYMRQQKKQGGK